MILKRLLTTANGGWETWCSQGVQSPIPMQIHFGAAPEIIASTIHLPYSSMYCLHWILWDIGNQSQIWNSYKNVKLPAQEKPSARRATQKWKLTALSPSMTASSVRLLTVASSICFMSASQNSQTTGMLTVGFGCVDLIFPRSSTKACVAGDRFPWHWLKKMHKSVKFVFEALSIISSTCLETAASHYKTERPLDKMKMEDAN